MLLLSLLSRWLVVLKGDGRVFMKIWFFRLSVVILMFVVVWLMYML